MSMCHWRIPARHRFGRRPHDISAGFMAIAEMGCPDHDWVMTD